MKIFAEIHLLPKCEDDPKKGPAGSQLHGQKQAIAQTLILTLLVGKFHPRLRCP